MFWTRWSPMNAGAWSQLHQLQDEVNRIFERCGDGFSTVAGAFPAVNVWEAADSLYVEAELPGVEMSDLEIFVTGQNQLTLKGHRKAPTFEKATAHRQERNAGQFARTLTLPFPVDEAKVEAKLDNGVLKLTLPKHEGAKPRRIPVKA